MWPQVRDSLRAAGLDVAIYDEVQVEPTDQSFLAAAKFAAEGRFDGYVSVGGGSVMDTAKAANLYATWPAEFLDYVNAPIGKGKAVPGPLKPHIACPTTCGTGSECTGIAIFDLLSMQVKTGIASRRLRPSLALIDPATTYTLPKNVVAASGFDILSHALESYTARPYTRRAAPGKPSLRPMSQGANPWSDIGCEAALKLLGQYLERGVNDAADHEARDNLMYAATLAGIAFGNSGVHVPHGMAYSVAGLVRDFHPDGYPGEEPIVPHGMSVVVNAPSVFRFTACACPDRHIAAAGWLGADTRGATDEDAGEVVAKQLIAMMKATGDSQRHRRRGLREGGRSGARQGRVGAAAPAHELAAGDHGRRARGPLPGGAEVLVRPGTARGRRIEFMNAFRGPAIPVAPPGHRHIQSPLDSGCRRRKAHPGTRADPSALSVREPGGTCR